MLCLECKIGQTSDFERNAHVRGTACQESRSGTGQVETVNCTIKQNRTDKIHMTGCCSDCEILYMIKDKCQVDSRDPCFNHRTFIDIEALSSKNLIQNNLDNLII